ncbi:hypothetical protein GO117_03050 [Campylobacter fetus]|nr:hypothetical protein CFF04554_0652 [Campylobacter fetus subsp. fetus 04/554]EDO9794467.1 hypothetical protein [Campylobacter fetus]HEG6043822.1 hypothetical protein [Campylobacter fetus]
MEKKFGLSLINSLTQNNEFKKEFISLIEKYQISNLKIAYNELNNF